MSGRCKITAWDKSYMHFTLRLDNPRRAAHRLATLGFVEGRPGAFVLRNTYCFFEGDYALVKTHQDNMRKMYKLLVK